MERLSWNEIETKAIAFAQRWKDCVGDERQEAQKFEIDFMNVFGVDWYNGLHEYQVRDVQGRIRYIDYLLPSKILIEMKSKGESLIRAYNQGYDYTKALAPVEYPELLMVSDFQYIQVTNLRTMKTFEKFKLSQLKNHTRMFGTLAGYTSEVTFKTDIEVNIDASYKMAELHDKLKASGYFGQDLEQYLVRLLFCLFAEDTGIFDNKAFEMYILNSREDGSDLYGRMMVLFNTLNTMESKRMNTLPIELRKFRYINGKLFEKELPPAYFDKKMRQTLIECCDFDWSYISPAIFGAMFQGVMDEKERREIGAHYTSEENILKLIKPLFLDSLWDEFEKCKYIKVDLEKFHDRLSTLRFLDPTCGCGNFLIITYRELRLLEFEILKFLYDSKQSIITPYICKISVQQFYGIEYKEFPSQIAQVGLLLIKHQMDREVSNYFGYNVIDFPIKEIANIIHGNSLRLNWEELIPKNELTYIIGNPPYIGKKYQNKEQRLDMLHVFGSNYKGVGSLDYVAAWYKKASDFINSTNIKVAFVSTNSIVQGEQVSILWEPIFKFNRIHFDFVYRTFEWSNDAKGVAAVHCVIIGFSNIFSDGQKYIYDGNMIIKAKNINAYLLDAPDIFIKSRNKPLCDVPKMSAANKPVDYNNLKIEEVDYKEFIRKDPLSIKYIKRMMGADEFIKNKVRYCLWLVDCPPDEMIKMQKVMERVEACRTARIISGTPEALKLSETPALFRETMNPEKYLIIPAVSSENRKYIPIGFQNEDVIPVMSVLIIPYAGLYHFGILTSNVHMAWMRVVCGRLESRYRYSKDIVYNNFLWPNPTEQQILSIEKAAQGVLDARSLYPDSSLAVLYNPLTMPLELLKAHRVLDREVCKAYGTIWKTEDECVSDLIQLYKLKIHEKELNTLKKSLL